MTTNFFPTYKQMYVVFYSTDRMRERHFENEAEANEFSTTVNGSVCPYTAKILPPLTAGQSRKLNNSRKQAKNWGY